METEGQRVVKMTERVHYLGALNLINTKHAAIAMAIFEICVQNSRFVYLFFDHGVPENLHVHQSLQLKAETNRDLSILILGD